MTQEIKTPVQIIQELIALHTTRKEAGERLKHAAPEAADSGTLTAASQQSEQFIAELMEELSGFGDGVSGDVNRDSAYHTMWTKTLEKLDTMNAQEAIGTFGLMESALADSYRQYLDTETELPDTVREILTVQAGKLKQ
jgi:hypothetical protein